MMMFSFHHKKKFLTLLCGFIAVIFSVSFVHAVTINKSVTNISSLKNNLVGHWTFDGNDTVNGAVVDRSGQGNNGGALNIATSTFYTTGRLGQAFNFDGVDDVVRIPHTSSISFDRTSPFSISTWIKMSSKNPGNGTWFGIVGKEPLPGYYLAVVSDSGGGENRNSVVFELSGTTEVLRVETPVNSIKLNQWYHVVMTYDGSSLASGVKIYINNVSQTISVFNDALVSESTTNTNPLFIGQDGNGGYMNGTIDDVRIYNRALSVADVGQLYKSGAGNAISKTVNPTSSLLNNLALWLTFDNKDISNGAIVDRSGSGNTGYPTNIATTTFYSAGKTGQAGNFDGADDYVSVPHSTSLNFERTDKFSISAWVKTTSKRPPSGGWYAIVGKNNITPVGYSFAVVPDFAAGSENRDALILSFSGASSALAASSPAGSIQPNRWYHVLVTYDGSSTVAGIQFYINNVLQTNKSVTASLNQTIQNTSPLRIGDDNTNDWFRGNVDDVRIYTRALTSTEVGQIYNMGADKFNKTVTDRASIASGLVGHWTFDGKDIVNGAIQDLSGTGNTGYPTSIATTTFYASGKIGQAANFDGVDDYVSVPHNSSLSFERTNPFSISAWIRPMTQAPPPGQWFSIVGKTSGTNGAGYFFAYNSNTSGTPPPNTLLVSLQGATGSQGIAIYVASPTIKQNQWQHVVLTYSGSSTAAGVTMYIDGQARTKTVTRDTLASTMINTNPLRIGDDATTDWMNGSIDDVRIYNRALTPSEVTQLYNMGK